MDRENRFEQGTVRQKTLSSVVLVCRDRYRVFNINTSYRLGDCSAKSPFFTSPIQYSLTHTFPVPLHIEREVQYPPHKIFHRNHFLKLSRAPTRHRVFHRNDSYRLACFSTESVRSSSDSNRRFGGGLLSRGTGLHQIGRAFLLVLFFCTSKRKEETAIFRKFN